MQLEKCGYTEPVRTIDELEGLAFELRRSVVVSRQPRGCVDDVLDTDESPPVSNGLVYECFRAPFVNLAVTHERAVDLVNAHGAVIGTADAAKCGCVIRAGIVDVQELPRGISNDSHKFCRNSMVCM